eukprot:106674-Hanusia_phi.AAC.1
MISSTARPGSESRIGLRPGSSGPVRARRSGSPDRVAGYRTIMIAGRIVGEPFRDARICRPAGGARQARGSDLGSDQWYYSGAAFAVSSARTSQTHCPRIIRVITVMSTCP